MKLDLKALQKKIHKMYADEITALGEEGTLRHLERGLAWDLSGTLSAGGVLVFPHITISDCAYQIAACAQACLDSGADRVIVISVLHAFDDAMDASRHRVADGSDPSVEPWWGIQGPGIDGREEWRGDHALVNWRYIWEAEVKRRGLAENKVPEVIERYPYLAAGQPDKLPGIEALRKIARDAVVVSTADPFHHGIGYGDSKEDASQPDEAGLQRARGMIEEAIAYLEKGDYPGYQQSCIRAKSDARDSGQVYRYLRGPMKGEIRDLTYSDATGLYDQPPPTWVAGALIEWTPVD